MKKDLRPVGGRVFAVVEWLNDKSPLWHRFTACNMLPGDAGPGERVVYTSQSWNAVCRKTKELNARHAAAKGTK